MTVRLVCGNCGKIVRFDSFDAADAAGWDAIDRYPYNACEECPGVSVYFPLMYAMQARSAGSPQEREALLAKAAEATLEFDPERSGAVAFDPVTGEQTTR